MATRKVALNHQMNNRSDKRWLCIELPVTEYREAWSLQSNLVAARKDKSIETDVVLLLEYLPVFTIGNNGGLKNLTVSKKSLEKAGIPLIRVERGGDITFHGPGQLVIYPIVDLHTACDCEGDIVFSLPIAAEKKCLCQSACVCD